MIKLFYNTVFVLALMPFLLFAQEVPNALNFTVTQINNARTDGKPESKNSPEFAVNEEITGLENRILEIRKSANPDNSEITNLQNQISAITRQSVTMQASFYPGRVTSATMLEQFDAVGNTLILSKNNMKCIATVTEYTGATAGRMWAVAGFQGTGSSATPDSLRVLYSTDNGTSWIPYANITLGGTDKINYGDIDAELIEGGTNKFLHIVYGLRASGGTGKWFAGGASIQLTGTFNGSVWAFNWPGDDATKRYYCPRITSDNFVWPTSPWVYVAVSFDSAGASGRVNTQKFAQLNSPNNVNPVFNYKANKIYWYSETATQQNLYTDIAFFQRGFIDSLVISYSGVADSTKVFFSKMSASGGLISPVNPGQYIGPVGGSEPNYMKYGGRLSSNGNNNGSIFFIFNQKSPTTDGVKYFRTTNYGDFNTLFQSVVWTAPSGVSFPDIVGVRGAAAHRFGFFFRGTSSDSLKYVSVNSDGTFGTVSGRMNSVNLTSGLLGPSVGLRFASGDSCFALYSGSGQTNLWSAYGCSGIITGVTIPETPVDYSLKQNYPNPFNPVTKINYSVAKSGFVSLKVYDILGKEVSVLVNEVKNPGNYAVAFNAGNLANGVYFYKIETDGFSSVRKMVLLK
ncbi:MAG: T9SS type A sorting domain-containing protein [Ignavibacteria bacterium]|nr:T9SS type A sorting domain-containing protein [Ignavibacteria bacterium]